jgi:hypothetical protein
LVDGVSEGTAALNYHPYNNPKPTTAALQSATTIGAGTHTIKAVYNADPSAASSCFNNWQGMTKNCFLGSSGTSSFTVLPAPTVTSLYNTSLPALGRPRFSTGFTVSNDTAKIGGFAQVDPGTTVELLMDGRVVDSAKVPSNGASGATPPELAVNVPSGQHTLMAKYLGDANQLPSVSPPITVQGSGGTPTTTSPSSCTPTASRGVRVLSGDPPCLTLTTILSGGGKTGAMIEVPVGTRITDEATLSGPNAASATGTVTYLVYDNAACSGPALAAGGGAVDGGIVHPSDPIPLTRNANGAVFGYWRAKYSGDGTNPPVFTACGGEEALALSPGTTSRPAAVGDAYKIDSLSFDDQAKRRAQLAIEDKINVLNQRIDEASKARTSALKAYLEQGDRATQAGIAWSLKEKAYESALAKYEALQEAVYTPDPEALRQAGQNANQLFNEASALAIPAQNQRTAAVNAGLSFRVADDALSQLNTQLIALQEQLSEVSATSSLRSLSVTANGEVVYKATFSGEAARKLHDFDAFRATIEAKLKQAAAERDRSEAIAIDANNEAQRDLDSLLDAIKVHADAKAVSTVYAGITAALQGFAEEGGPIGALLNVASWGLFEVMAESVPNDLELGEKIEAQLAPGARQASWKLPVTEAKLVGWGLRYGVPVVGARLYGPLIDTANKLVTDYFAASAQQQFSGIPGFAELESQIRLVAAQNAQLERAIGRLTELRSAASVSGWRTVVNGLSTKATYAGRAGAAAAYAYADYKTNQFFENEVATAWATYVLAYDIANAQTDIFIRQSQYARWLSDFDHLLLSREELFLSDERARGGFDESMASIFHEGDTLTLTTDPPITEFSSVSAEVGGERMSFGRGDSLTARAVALESHSNDPRLVALTLSLGK